MALKKTEWLPKQIIELVEKVNTSVLKCAQPHVSASALERDQWRKSDRGRCTVASMTEARA